MKIIFSFLLIATLHAAYGQSTENKTMPGREDYLRKSKTQKTWAWITGGTGALVFTVGLIMYMSEFEDGLSGAPGYNEKSAKTGETLMYVGGGLVLVSIPFSIAYKKNAKLAVSLSIRNRPVLYPPLAGKSFAFAPSLCVRIDLAKHDRQMQQATQGL
jgi:hypothetical protein